jgi:hypothetical protein
MEEGGTDDNLVQLAREAFALFDKNNSGNIDQKVEHNLSLSNIKMCHY